MRLSTLALLSFTFCLSNVVRASSEENDDGDPEGYYWRDYNGVIPKDALPGGRNSQGHTTYIGQVLHQNQLIPAKIDPDQKMVTYEWGYVEYVAYENIKILCTQNVEQFEWVNTGHQHIRTVKGKNFVVGGYEPDVTLLIGRKEIDGELVLGKVVFGPNQSTLNTTKGGKGTQHALFQVLAYHPMKRKTSVSEIPTSIDIQQGNETTDCKIQHKTIVINLYN